MSILDDDCAEAVRLALMHEGVFGAYMVIQLLDSDRLIGPEPDASLARTLRKLADALDVRVSGRPN